MQSDCIPWQGGKSNGYGWDSKRRAYAHRVAYEEAHGAIPAGHYVCHRCDNPICVNPAHLFAGSPQANHDDTHAKGRARRARGEQVNTARLTAEQVLDIRRRVAEGATRAALAREYGVVWKTINRIVQRKYWTHLTTERGQ